LACAGGESGFVNLGESAAAKGSGSAAGSDATDSAGSTNETEETRGGERVGERGGEPAVKPGGEPGGESGEAGEGAREEVGDGASAYEIEMGPFMARRGATERSVRELHACFVGLRRMAKDGYAPTRRALLRELGLTDTAFKTFFEKYSDLVRYSGLRLSAGKRSAAARARRAELRGTIGQEIVEDVVEGKGAIKKESLAPGREKRETVLGERIEGYVMQHAPVNEQGVVMLFGLMAEKLGFLIEVVRQGFPDCEAKRKGWDEKWRRVRIEFEYLTSRFNHEKEGCDLVVCWKHDKKDIGVEVIELKSEMERLKRERH